ncbi:hypothetical protein COCON_G00185330 [Conger conger]|uniref:C-type lectin domain-containing protein n=1 Tax=Conger conger TaxID=82655 RepID=A0A9Q1HPU8_CONCO|nr:hypothetical protein COCON_G00185330 [Conger conger]
MEKGLQYLDNDKRQLVTDYNVWQRKIQRERDYSALETECQTLTREKKRVEEERKTLQQLLEEERDMFQRWNRTFMVVLENMKHKEQLQRDFDAVLAKSPFLDQYCPLSLQTIHPDWAQQFYSSVTTSPQRGGSWMDGRSDCIKQELTWFWRNGQPDDHFWFDSRTQYQDADCVVTVPGESAWMDTHCYSYRRFICETDALLL